MTTERPVLEVFVRCNFEDTGSTHGTAASAALPGVGNVVILLAEFSFFNSY
jgi:hypothetical protein